jgi:hypothetical protein
VKPYLPKFEMLSRHFSPAGSFSVLDFFFAFVYRVINEHYSLPVVQIAKQELSLEAEVRA